MLARALAAISQRVRPTWTEMMSMDSDLAEAVLGGLPRLDASAFGGGG